MTNNKKCTVERGGYQLTIEQYGSGPYLLIIGSVNYYKKITPKALHENFTCIYLDHRGFANTVHQAPSQTINLEVITEDIESICQLLEVRKTSVLGHSGHAYMAIHFAAHTQIEVDKLILVGASPNLSTRMQEMQFAHWTSHASSIRKSLLEASLQLMEDDISAHPERKFVHICRRLGPMRWKDAKFDELCLWNDVATNTVLLDILWGEVFRDIDITKMSSNLDLIVINGELDFSIAPIHVWKEIEPAFNSLELFELKGASHTPMLERPEEFISLVLRAHSA